MASRRYLGRSPIVLALALVAIVGCDGGGGGTKPPDDGEKTPIHLPARVGNRWNYAVTIESGGGADTSSRVQTVVSTWTYPKDGQLYYALESITEPDPPETTFVRQEGQSVFAVPAEMLIADTGVPEQDWVFRHLRGGLPWKLADFTGPTGQIFAAAAETTIEGAQIQLSLNIASAGRSDLSIPAGTFSDVYLARVTQLMVAKQQGIVVVSLSTRDDLYIADSVGVVKEVVEERFRQGGQNEQVVRTTSLLRSYAVEQ